VVTAAVFECTPLICERGILFKFDAFWMDPSVCMGFHDIVDRKRVKLGRRNVAPPAIADRVDRGLHVRFLDRFYVCHNRHQLCFGIPEIHLHQSSNFTQLGQLEKCLVSSLCVVEGERILRNDIDVRAVQRVLYKRATHHAQRLHHCVTDHLSQAIRMIDFASQLDHEHVV
jgi:hypothetical protein